MAARIKSMKNSSDTIGNRTHDLLAYSAVTQPTAPPHSPNIILYYYNTYHCVTIAYSIQYSNMLYRFVA